MEISDGLICYCILYQSTTRESIELSVCDVSTNDQQILNDGVQSIKIVAPARFKMGDSVRVSKYKTLFEKDYTQNWTTKMFKITKMQKTNPVTYLLEDPCGKPVARGFYEYELHRVANLDVYLIKKVRKKRN